MALSTVEETAITLQPLLPGFSATLSRAKMESVCKVRGGLRARSAWLPVCLFRDIDSGAATPPRASWTPARSLFGTCSIGRATTMGNRSTRAGCARTPHPGRARLGGAQGHVCTWDDCRPRAQVKAVLLVGGATRMPAVRQLVRDITQQARVCLD